MTADRNAVDLDHLAALLVEPERTCQWCMARPGEWCEHDCASPWRRCHPSYVAEFAAQRGCYSDHDAALIVAAVNALPALIAAARERDRLQAKLDAVLAKCNQMEREAPKPQVGGFIADEFRAVVTDTTGAIR